MSIRHYPFFYFLIFFEGLIIDKTIKDFTTRLSDIYVFSQARHFIKISYVKGSEIFKRSTSTKLV